MSADDEEKGHEPTQKKLEDARARGEVARSADLTAAAAMAGLTLAALVTGPGAVRRFGTAAQEMMAQAGRMARAGDPAAAAWGTGAGLGQLILPVIPFFVLPALGALLALIGQRGLTFSAEKLAPRLSRIDPLANAAHRFGRAGLADFSRNLLRLCLTGAASGWFLALRLPQAIQAMQVPAAQVGGLALSLLSELLVLAALVAALLGGADFLWQRFEHLRRNRMSRQELVDEFRQSEGDPHMKGQRRQRAQAIAMNRMLADVARADVVVVNPTHFAVALKWTRASGRAPVCLAKGTDAVAARIRERAAAAGVPIHSDPPTARALHAAVEIGAEIRPEHYAAVAAAIRYAERMRRRARERGFG
ncbi:MAG: flagellar type III secretion system protein FlhB [Proteobacteria bacterium]|nr:flagellar type III secretion system protein FlhB [Pseudomonadota bacterium]MBS0574172.1 flagellar type III secretion system protein FlhB [Pseudomonadota bacterium]